MKAPDKSLEPTLLADGQLLRVLPLCGAKVDPRRLSHPAAQLEAVRRGWAIVLPHRQPDLPSRGETTCPLMSNPESKRSPPFAN
jgi:hypothetical protein